MYNYLFFLIISFVTFDYLFGTFLSYLNRKAASPELPQQLQGLYDQKEYARQQRYFKKNNFFSAVTRTYEFLLLLLMLFIGGYGWIDAIAYNLTPSPVLAALFFFGVIYIGNDLLSLPFAYYDTFVIEQQFGFNKMTPKLFFTDILKGWLISALLGGGLITIVYLLFQEWRETFWIYAWVIISIITVFISFFYSAWIVPLFNKQTPLEEGPLRTAIEAFAQKVDFKINNIYVMDGSKRSTKANAYFTGWGKRKRVVLYDTLIKELSTEEVVAVLAHEIGHYKHHHTHYGMILSILNTFVLLFVFSLLVENQTLAKAMGGDFPTFELGVIAFTLLYSPIGLVTGVVINLFSRKNEYKADAFAGKEGLAAPLISGLQKISVHALSNLTPSLAYVFVYYSHPTLLQRINRLKIYLNHEN